MDKQQIKDISERALSTFWQAGGAFIITYLIAQLNDIQLRSNSWIIVLFVMILSAILSAFKGYLATKFGDGSASTVNLSGDQGSEEDDEAYGLPARADTIAAMEEAKDADDSIVLTNPVDGK